MTNFNAARQMFLLDQAAADKTELPEPREPGTPGAWLATFIIERGDTFARINWYRMDELNALVNNLPVGSILRTVQVILPTTHWDHDCDPMPNLVHMPKTVWRA